jgi:hypothetical protein
MLPHIGCRVVALSVLVGGIQETGVGVVVVAGMPPRWCNGELELDTGSTFHAALASLLMCWTDSPINPLWGTRQPSSIVKHTNMSMGMWYTCLGASASASGSIELVNVDTHMPPTRPTVASQKGPSIDRNNLGGNRRTRRTTYYGGTQPDESVTPRLCWANHMCPNSSTGC